MEVKNLIHSNRLINGVWDIYLISGEEWIRFVTRLNGIEDKRSIVNMPQIISPNLQNENKVVKVYYTLYEEVSILVRNHIVNKKLQRILFNKNELIIDGLLNIQTPNDEIPELIEGNIRFKLPYGHKMKLPVKVKLIKTGRTLLEYKYIISAAINNSQKENIYQNINFDLCECEIKFGQSNSVFYLNLLPSKIESTLEGLFVKNSELRRLSNSIKLKFYYFMNKVVPINSKYVIFQSTTGMNYSCNPRGLYEEMLKQSIDFKPVWVVNKTNQKIQGNPKIVKPNTLRYYYYLAIGKYFVNNGNFPDFYKKRKNTVHIQTWHGTPLKKLGFDIDPSSPSYKENTSENLIRRNKRWDYLVSPNKYTGNILQRAYLFKNQILNVGYPRNDILYQDKDFKSDQVNKIRSYLNIPANKKIILYAPTWRDNDFHNGLFNEPYEFKFNLNDFVERFGNEYVLLVRLHPRDSIRCQIREYENIIYNVSNYDDIKLLYLISDLLITDYSSVMFDFANTKKPIIFFAYDIKQYSSALRGFYFNLHRDAPGPIVTNGKDLLDTIEISRSLPELYFDKYEEFYNKFCSWEDGCASQRIINQVFYSLKS
ncbi:CDP-glycerol glycerophosphotransferase family protein [Virgibacillus sp. Bac332]|uniref:CDP-glycerol glycerophosphotransferase family protein n=1 Tax=Virgibacillus sp. Bac332 TaxID=2419842 RepID=UPI000EF46BD7|nr:CDP-glycerol glycerophosphotransferase family protein [Virgibacillus sp. Bac332]